MPQLSQSLLIALEGIDGSGKSTLAHNLFNLFQQEKFNTILTKEPGASELGKKIRTIIQNQTIPLSPQAEYLLFAADRAQHFAECIIPALKEKKIIISDRMSDSSLAYQGYGNNLNLEMLNTINTWTMNSIIPHLIIFVRVPVTIALERAKKRGTLSAYEQREDFLYRVAHGFEEIYKNRKNVMFIDGTQSSETLALQTFKTIKQWLKTQDTKIFSL